MFPELCECACSIHGITVLNLFDAHLQGSVKLVSGHGVSVQSRRSFRQDRERECCPSGDLAQGDISMAVAIGDAELLQHILGLLFDGRVDKD